jgi:hypothetical protein
VFVYSCALGYLVFAAMQWSRLRRPLALSSAAAAAAAAAVSEQRGRCNLHGATAGGAIDHIAAARDVYRLASCLS